MNKQMTTKKVLYILPLATGFQNSYYIKKGRRRLDLHLLPPPSIFFFLSCLCCDSDLEAPLSPEA